MLHLSNTGRNNGNLCLLVNNYLFRNLFTVVCVYINTMKFSFLTNFSHKTSLQENEENVNQDNFFGS